MRALPLLLVATLAAPAMAQAVDPVALSLEATSDQRRRGLSWSDGRPTIEGTLYLAPAEGVTLSAGGTLLRRSARHGGADAVIDLAARAGRELGGFRLSGGVVGHFFAGGAGALDYAEAEASLSTLIGPARIAATVGYAPRQRAIGGDNLHLGVNADVAIPTTPLTVSAAIGRSTGRVRDPLRSARLRPDGGYWDYRIGVEAIRGPLAAGLRLTATSIGRADDAGTRLAAYLRADL